MVDQQLIARDIRDPRVLQAMRQVPRHRFVPDQPLERAYADCALPTLNGQTISQPYIVAKMTELLSIRPGMKVLEVGTGSGYQTMLLAALGASVISIERDAALVTQAKAILREIAPGAGIVVVTGDGTLGYPVAAPYDRIIITAAAPRLPQPLHDQLADQGRIVAPIGGREQQTLTTFTRDADDWVDEAHTPCRFVPLIGQEGW
ncbi:MAG: protein-L-isoaspartate(D-aspartate) O-methyltransferase [Rhodospirillales bacterium]|nr:protein-L-isoaspartate(D-aspartate) O-methyltransferase [Rhodospirillales bacterium]